MIACNHWRTAAGCWLAGGAVAVALGAPPVLVAGLGAYALIAALGPDIDKPPEHGKGGATAAEAHGIVSNALAEIVAATHGGHRGLTHRYGYALALGVFVAGLAVLWPVYVALVLGAWWGAWPLYCSLPRRSRWTAALLAPGLAAVAFVVGVLPATPWLGLAVAFGWAAHIACDHWQTRLFAIGGTVEHLVAYAALIAGAACFGLATAGWWPHLPTA